MSFLGVFQRAAKFELMFPNWFPVEDQFLNTNNFVLVQFIVETDKETDALAIYLGKTSSS